MTFDNTDQHVFHHNNTDGPRVALKVEKNSKGHNWEVSVSGARTVEEAMALIRTGDAALREQFGERKEENNG